MGKARVPALLEFAFDGYKYFIADFANVKGLTLSFSVIQYVLLSVQS